MMTKKRNGLYVVECVSIGHPDKLCDMIADMILDEYMKYDKNTLSNIEVAIKNNTVFVFGEVNSKASIDIKKCVCSVFDSVGIKYDDDKIKIINEISNYSCNVTKAVNEGYVKDNALVVGYACRDTYERMPLPVMIARKICNCLTESSWTIALGDRDFTLPNGKCQIIAEYKDGRFMGIKTIVVSWAHIEKYSKKINPKRYNDFLVSVKYRIKYTLKQYGIYSIEGINILINPDEDFIDNNECINAGATGHRDAIETYGTFCMTGGNSMYGKDPTNINRAGAYMSRAIAVGIINAFPQVDECKVQLVYSAGKLNPVNISIETDVDDSEVKAKIDDLIENIYTCQSLTPRHIIDRLDLSKPIYFEAAFEGHFTNPEYPWNSFTFSGL